MTYAALGVTPVIVMVILIAIRNAILGYGVRPAVYGRTVSIHPALVLVALPAGFQLAGIVGLFAAVPVTAIVLAVASATVAIVDPGPRPGLPALVPAWLDRVAQWSWRILVAIGLGALLVGILVAMPLVVIPVVVATILAATLAPLVAVLVARGQSRGRAAATSVGGGFLLVVGIVLLALVALVRPGFRHRRDDEPGGRFGRQRDGRRPRAASRARCPRGASSSSRRPSGSARMRPRCS